MYCLLIMINTNKHYITRHGNQIQQEKYLSYITQHDSSPYYKPTFNKRNHGNYISFNKAVPKIHIFSLSVNLKRFHFYNNVTYICYCETAITF